MSQPNGKQARSLPLGSPSRAGVLRRVRKIMAEYSLLLPNSPHRHRPIHVLVTLLADLQEFSDDEGLSFEECYQLAFEQYQRRQLDDRQILTHQRTRT